jgi:hypothetical protein
MASGGVGPSERRRSDLAAEVAGRAARLDRVVVVGAEYRDHDSTAPSSGDDVVIDIGQGRTR